MHRDQTLGCAVAFATCFGAVLIANASFQSTTSQYSAPALQTAARVVVQPISSRYPTPPLEASTDAAMQLNSGVMVSTSQDTLPSPIHSAGILALSVSAALAVAGLGLRVYSYLQPRRPVSPLSFMEMVQVDETIAMAATTADKKAAKKAKKAAKAAKKEEPKKEKVKVVLPVKEVFKRMHKGAVAYARTKKPTKTTGRVCQILGKVDNRQARAVSFSHRRTKRVQMVNLHWRRLWWEEGKCFVLLRLSTKGIKTITKYGLHQAAIKFGLDLTKNVNGVSERKYVKHLPEKEKKLAMLRGVHQRWQSAVRWARLNDEEPPARPKRVAGQDGPAVIAMAISHGVKAPHLALPADQRKALLRSLTTELIRHGRIKTTLIRAKAVRKHVDHMITLAKEGSLHARRQALAYIYDKDLVKTLFDQAPERYADRNGGYTRINHTLPRKGDAAKMCYIELL